MGSVFLDLGQHLKSAFHLLAAFVQEKATSVIGYDGYVRQAGTLHLLPYRLDFGVRNPNSLGDRSILPCLASRKESDDSSLRWRHRQGQVGSLFIGQWRRRAHGDLAPSSKTVLPVPSHALLRGVDKNQWPGLLDAEFGAGGAAKFAGGEDLAGFVERDEAGIERCIP